jgi:hypothetical protein
MDKNRILLAMVVLALAVGFAWAATEISGFTAVPESEAAQIVGGAGYVCDYNDSITKGPHFWPCYKDPNNPACGMGAWCFLEARYGCVPADSGTCYTDLYVLCEYGACVWDAENGYCAYDGEVYYDYIESCG